jgi:hypothetical protein
MEEKPNEDHIYLRNDQIFLDVQHVVDASGLELWKLLAALFEELRNRVSFFALHGGILFRVSKSEYCTSLCTMLGGKRKNKKEKKKRANLNGFPMAAAIPVTVRDLYRLLCVKSKRNEVHQQYVRDWRNG